MGPGHVARGQSEGGSALRYRPVALILLRHAVDRDWHKEITVQCRNAANNEQSAFVFRYDRVVGNGSFGIVCSITECGTGTRYALKKVFQDRGYQVRVR